MDAETVNQRMRAARALRGLEQTDLDELFAKHGLGKQEASRLERGELPLTAARRHALIQTLRVPEAWFLEENADEIIGVMGEDYSINERLAAIEEEMKSQAFVANNREMAIERQLRAVAQAIDRLQPPRQP
jgi:transcriptional regulator with XRE-family HTH domain